MKKEKEYTGNLFLDKALSRLRENYFAKRTKVEKLYDLESLKDVVKNIKSRNVDNIDKNLEDFTKALSKNGVKYYIAKDKDDARQTILSLIEKNGIKNIVKSKSLTTEEIELNDFLKINGLDAVETDIGEWLVQINNEPPTHMTAPAIHMPREKINELLNTKFNENLSLDIKEMVDFSKNKIRENFKKSECGIIGANVASIESGSFFIVSNEGNVQNVIRQNLVICVMGIDKIVKNDEEAFKIVELLPKAATGQVTTSFIDVIKKPFYDFFVVLIDNGRSGIAKDNSFKEILNCIRCGACQNACPVYTTVGGGFFRGKTYAGPIGILLSYFTKDTPNILEYASLCTGCMACDEICSSRINLQEMIVEIKTRNTKNTPGIKGLIIKRLENRYGFLRISALFAHFLFKKELRVGVGKIDTALGNNFRQLPSVNPSFDTIKTKKSKICLFAGCSTNFFYNNIGYDALSVGEKLGIDIEVIKQKSCCGAPAYYNGERKSAIEAAQINIEYLMSLECENILFLDPHCAHMIKRDYTIINKTKKAKELSDKVTCAGSFFLSKIERDGIKTARLGSFLGYHIPCHLNRGLHQSKEIENFLKTNEPNFIQIEDADRCCGFAGSYSIMHPYISSKLLDKKIISIEKANIQTLITACPGCMMQIGGGLKIKHSNVELLHFVSYLNKIL